MITMQKQGELGWIVKGDDAKGLVAGAYEDKPVQRVRALVAEENDYDWEETNDQAVLHEKIELSMNHDPDGALFWVSKEKAEAVWDLLCGVWQSAIELDSFNLDNGGVGEMLLWQELEDGVLISFLDPECLSPLIEDAVTILTAPQKKDLEVVVYTEGHLRGKIYRMQKSLEEPGEEWIPEGGVEEQFRDKLMKMN